MTIEAIAAGGDGVAHESSARIFVPLTAPGDIAEIEIRGDRGALIELKEGAAIRAAAPCRHYGRCGGCALQHVTGEFYRDWKRERVVGPLARAGFDANIVGALVETPAPTRRRATFAVRRTGAQTVLGFNARRSASIEAIEDCLVLHPDIVRNLPALRALAARIDAREFDLAITLCENGIDAAIAAREIDEPRGAALIEHLSLMRAAGVVRLSVNGEIVAALQSPQVSFAGVAAAPPAGGFLQASREGEAALVALVAGAAAGAKKIADLFSGCGTFSLALAKSAAVTAFDSHAGAIAALTQAASNAQRAGMATNPLSAETRNLFERPVTAKELKRFDAVIFDPPRAGAPAQSREIAASSLGLAIGVSCNPATFARDAAILREGGFRLEVVTPVDQFVYSSHVELVGVFTRGT
ncbi:MAG: hypothetical protein R3C42_08850 [Parvularculaceae bacterium]|nr:class I SAM-dependent RNA methyltransferase [Parvularculaceae bacterium]